MAGLYFEDLQPGTKYIHDASRTVTLADSIQYACMCMDTEPSFLSEYWAQQHAQHARVEIHPLYVLSIVLGVQVTDLTLGTTLGNLSMGGIRFPNPVFPGDTLRGTTTIIARRESETKPDRGVVDFLHEGFNQRNEVIVQCSRRGMMLRRPATNTKPEQRRDPHDDGRI
jgi:acyl dehydratase